jgi:hypothetical protein
LIVDKMATGSRRARRGWRTWCAVVAVGASSFAGSGVAIAQGVEGEGELPPSSNSELAPPVALTEQRDVDLSPQERLQHAQELVSSIERSSQAVLRQLQVARQERDVVRVLCLNDKLNQVDVALRSAQDRMTALKTAVERADTDRARHEYTVLDVLNDRVRVLVSESNQCVGEETGFIGEAEVSVTVDPNLPDGTLDQSTTAPFVPPAPLVQSPIE